MNGKPQSPNTHSGRRGFTILEVLIAVVVLSVGLLAIAALQGNLSRSASEARARSVALNLAEERFEQFRAFLDRAEYDAIVSSANPEVIEPEGSGASFTRTSTVTRMVFDQVADDFVEAAAGDPASTREFKIVEVEVSWIGADGTENVARLNNIISSSTPADSAQALRANIGRAQGPQVRIVRPDDPAIIPIGIGADQASASSNPQPEIARSGNTTLTQFNVQTYVGVDAENPLLQRRIDNAVINCACQFDGTSTTADPAFEPTYWNGLRYNSPRPVAGKPKGRSSTQFSQQFERFERGLCNTCCRDHHETSGYERDDRRIVKYDVWRPAWDVIGTNGNHNHYSPSADFENNCTEQTDGSFVCGGSGQGSAAPILSGTYGEVCRLVRVDGVFRVATDMRLENATMMRLGPTLTHGDEFAPDVAETYAELVRSYVLAAWNGLDAFWGGGKLAANIDQDYPDLIEHCGADGDGNESCGPTSLALSESGSGDMTIRELVDYEGVNVVDLLPGEQYDLVLRGLYIDYISDETRNALGCVGKDPDAFPECRFFSSFNVLEILPFTAINLTNLAHWHSDPAGVVSVRNDGVSNAGYVRGRVTGISGNPDGSSRATEVFAVSRRGNAGLIDRRATDPDDHFSTRAGREQFTAFGEPVDIFRIRIVDESSAPADFDRFNLILEVRNPTVPGPVCDRSGGTHFCRLTKDATSVTFQSGNYNIIACPVDEAITWVYDPEEDICRSPDGATTQPNVIDYKLCGFRNLQPGNQVRITSSTVHENPGQGSELAVTTFQAQASGQNTTLADYQLTSGKVVDAVFVRQSDTCPTGLD